MRDKVQPQKPSQQREAYLHSKAKRKRRRQLRAGNVRPALSAARQAITMQQPNGHLLLSSIENGPCGTHANARLLARLRLKEKTGRSAKKGDFSSDATADSENSATSDATADSKNSAKKEPEYSPLKNYS